MDRYRLINVSQVVIVPRAQPEATLDLRPTMVEIAAEPLKTSVVMFRAFDGDNPLCSVPDPKAVGRMVFPGASVVRPADEQEGLTWLVRTDHFDVFVRPQRGVQIYRDPSFGLEDADSELRELYDQLRYNHWSLAGHQSLLATTPASATGAVAAHNQSIAAVEASIRRLSVRIAIKSRKVRS